jgi:hypothetical protein
MFKFTLKISFTKLRAVYWGYPKEKESNARLKNVVKFYQKIFLCNLRIFKL